MYNFNYYRARSLPQAQDLIVEQNEAKIIAGGQTLLPTMKQRLASPPALIDLKYIEGLSGIEQQGRNILIGAMTRHAEVASSPLVRDALPALAHLAGLIGDPAVRHMGTLGGSVANNDPNADYPAACLAVAATIITTKREVAADEYFKGLFETALEPDEIITKISFPLPEKASYHKFRNPASRYALVGVFVAARSLDVRVAVTGAGANGVFRVTEFEEALQHRFSPSALDGIDVDPSLMGSDIHAGARYRAHLVNVIARHAIADLVKSKEA